MKTSKIQRIAKVKEWTSPKGQKVHYHDLEMVNGDKINIGKASLLKLGDELTYEITDDDTTKGNYLKAKSVNAFSQKFGKPNLPRINEEAILYQVCLKEALHLIEIDGWDGKEEMKDKIDHLNNIAYQLSVGAKENIKKLKG